MAAFAPSSKKNSSSTHADAQSLNVGTHFSYRFRARLGRTLLTVLAGRYCGINRWSYFCGTHSSDTREIPGLSLRSFCRDGCLRNFLWAPGPLLAVGKILESTQRKRSHHCCYGSVNRILFLVLRPIGGFRGRVHVCPVWRELASGLRVSVLCSLPRSWRNGRATGSGLAA